MRRALSRALALGALVFALSVAGETSTAQQEPAPPVPAILVADSVFIEGRDRLVATGNVEAIQDGIRLTAARIAYDGATGLLTIDGPITITDPANRVTVLADAAQLDESLRNGLLSGARMVLDDQLQMAAVEAQQVDGRYVQLSRTAITSCRICAEGRAPLWQIRAARVIHDREARQIYLDQAQLRVLDVPVAFIPRLRLPDPSLPRARGFLFPTLRSSTLLGFGIKVPYFIPIGDHRDLTLTPYVSPVTRTLEYRYRQAFRAGDIAITGALSSDTLQDGDARGYIFAEGSFDLPRDLRLSFDLKAVSDPGYLSDYGVTDTDRLASSVELTQVRADRRMVATLLHYESLRESEDNDTQPTLFGDLRYERRFFPAAFPGEIRLAGVGHTHYRYSSRDVDGPDADSEVDGRDVTRLNLEASWRHRWTLPAGLRAGATAQLWLDHFRIDDDAAAPDEVSRAVPGAAVELRWPLMRRGAGGGRTLLEPVAQLGWIGGDRAGVPNDESTRVEFDEANLLSLSRYPAADRREHGTTLAAGLRLAHAAPIGWSAALTVGRIWRDDPDPDFTRSSGLEGTESDWLIAGRFSAPGGLGITARGLLDETGRFAKAEARAAWSNPRLDLGASYVLLVTDTDEDRDRAQSEWTLDASYRLSRHWESSTEWRYDLADRRLDRVGLGLQYRNECVEVALSATRRLASSTTFEPSTDFDLTVALLGFSTGGSAKEYRRTCTQ